VKNSPLRLFGDSLVVSRRLDGKLHFNPDASRSSGTTGRLEAWFVNFHGGIADGAITMKCQVRPSSAPTSFYVTQLVLLPDVLTASRTDIKQTLLFPFPCSLSPVLLPATFLSLMRFKEKKNNEQLDNLTLALNAIYAVVRVVGTFACNYVVTYPPRGTGLTKWREIYETKPCVLLSTHFLIILVRFEFATRITSSANVT